MWPVRCTGCRATIKLISLTSENVQKLDLEAPAFVNNFSSYSINSYQFWLKKQLIIMNKWIRKNR